jgi:hypothetical protein
MYYRVFSSVSVFYPLDARSDPPSTSSQDIAILNKQKCHFSSFTKSENRRAEQVLPAAWCQWKRGGGRERVQEDEYSANTVYAYM